MSNWKIGCLLACTLMIGACSGGGGGDAEEPDNDDQQAQNPDQPMNPDPNPDPEEQNPAMELPRADIRDEDQLFAYRSGSPYAAVLRDCALIKNASEACDLTKLPFIGQQSQPVTREAIMNRLLVTHDWMGDRFEALLNEAPEDLIPLFGSLTSISIGSTVRPSYYWTGTGAIRLDPAGLWLSIYEKSTVAIEDDFRSDYGRDLRFWALRTLRVNGQRVLGFYPLTDYQERSLEDIKISMYRLFYHELAHAVDFMPTNQLALIDPTMLPVEAINGASDDWLAWRLQSNLPLFSSQLQSLAQVRYGGAQASELEKTYTAEYVGSLMGGDGGTLFYAYSTSQEDVATLFAATMLKKNLNVDTHIAFSVKPADEDNFECSEIIIGWGAYDRVAHSRVLPRAKWVYEEIYGQSMEADQFFNALDGTASLMTQGLDWCVNLDNEAQNSSVEFQASGPLESTHNQMQLLNMDRQQITH